MKQPPQTGTLVMPTPEQIQAELQKIDPTATVECILHDQIDVVCSTPLRDAVARRLSELVSVTHLKTTEFDFDVEATETGRSRSDATERCGRLPRR